MTQSAAWRPRKWDAIASAFWSHPWRYIVAGALLFSALWWVIEPWYVSDYGRPAKAVVLSTWPTNMYETVFIATWRMHGVLLEVSLPDGQTRQVTKYCPATQDDDRPPTPVGAQFDARLDPVARWRVVLRGADCDFQQSFFVSCVLLGIGGYSLYRLARK